MQPALDHHQNRFTPMPHLSRKFTKIHSQLLQLFCWHLVITAHTAWLLINQEIFCQHYSKMGCRSHKVSSWEPQWQNFTVCLCHPKNNMNTAPALLTYWRNMTKWSDKIQEQLTDAVTDDKVLPDLLQLLETLGDVQSQIDQRTISFTLCQQQQQHITEYYYYYNNYSYYF